MLTWNINALKMFCNFPQKCRRLKLITPLCMDVRTCGHSLTCHQSYFCHWKYCYFFKLMLLFLLVGLLVVVTEMADLLDGWFPLFARMNVNEVTQTKWFASGDVEATVLQLMPVWNQQQREKNEVRMAKIKKFKRDVDVCN